MLSERVREVNHDLCRTLELIMPRTSFAGTDYELIWCRVMIDNDAINSCGQRRTSFSTRSRHPASSGQ
jgi:hypothetical protein